MLRGAGKASEAGTRRWKPSKPRPAKQAEPAIVTTNDDVEKVWGPVYESGLDDNVRLLMQTFAIKLSHRFP